jgi:carboxymethylenebutenolidase
MSIPNSAGRTVALAADNQAYLANAGRDGAPGIVVIQEAFGVNAFVKATCDRLAARGLNAIAPDYYHGRTFDYADRDNAIAALNNIDDDIAMRETAAGVDALVTHGARRDAIAVVGFCMGGRLAFLANATLGSRLAATVSFYGGGIAPPEPKGKRKPLLDRVGDITTPALLIYGAKDASIGAEEHARLARALTEANKRYTIAVFPDAPHAFATFDRESYHEQAAAHAWRTADDFLAAIFGR